MTAQKAPEDKQKSELRNLQDKFHNLLDQRNHYNDLAREARDNRNLLNDQRREKAEELQKHKEARDATNAKMRAAKETRNAYQDQAKALIAQKKGKKGAIERSLPLKLRKLRNEVEQAMEKQETTVLSPEKERDLIDAVRAKKAEIKELEQQLGEQQALQVDLDDTDKAIDELFANADAEHEKVKALNAEASGHHEKFVAALKEIRTLQKESDEKHQEFIAIRKKADGYHEKAMELREKVMAIKKERHEDYKARKQEIRDINESARRRVDDPKAREKATEDALEQLKKGGKISL